MDNGYVLIVERQDGIGPIAMKAGSGLMTACAFAHQYMQRLGLVDGFGWEPVGRWCWFGWGLDACGEVVFLTVWLRALVRNLN